MATVYLLIVTFLCLIPFGIALSYFVVGLVSYFNGKKENSRVKISGGTHTAILSFMGMVLIAFIWAWICQFI